MWSNFIWFTIHVFSLPQLFATWLSPWKRIEERRSQRWSAGDFFSTLLINTISRLLGFAFRSVVIVAGIIFLAATALAGLLVIAVWFALPLAPVTLLVTGLAVIVAAY
jgi:hypothetical protein